MKDYYQILGVNENSSKDEIKKSYRKLSKQFHPDVNPEGVDKFKEIAEAYDVLGDDNKKSKYDFERKNPFGGMGGNFGDMFDMFNGGFNPFNQRRKPRAADKIININLYPTESFTGIKKSINYQRKEECSVCRGTGGDKINCGTCQGSGVIQQRFNFNGQTFVQNNTCTTCNGRGTVITNGCFNCNTNGFKMNLNNITVDIPKSVDNGDFLRVPSAGDYQSGSGYGDLVIQIKMINDNVYQKIGNNLHTFVKLSPEELFKKEDIQLEHPEGSIKIKFPPKFDTSVPIRVRTKGYFTQEGKGDFIIKFDVDVTKSKLTESQIEQITDILKQST
jgi:molecular chaperone DnaJ